MEDYSDPRHIYNVRARRAADQAEREMFQKLALEVDPRPRPGIFDMLKRALESER